MKQLLMKLILVAALSATAVLPVSEAWAASRAQVKEISALFDFDGQFTPTVDGLINAMRKMPGMLSGKSNRDTEELRVGLMREHVHGRKDEILKAAQDHVSQTWDETEIDTFLTKLKAREFEDATVIEMREAVVKGYRDVIFSAIGQAVVVAHDRAEAMRESGEVKQ